MQYEYERLDRSKRQCNIHSFITLGLGNASFQYTHFFLWGGRRMIWFRPVQMALPALTRTGFGGCPASAYPRTQGRRGAACWLAVHCSVQTDRVSVSVWTRSKAPEIVDA